MKFIADLHIHSHFSLATSKELIPQHLDKWARLKGIKLVGTGDITHPKWLDEIQGVLQPAEQGFFKLKDEFKLALPFDTTQLFDDDVRFILTGEISCIYKQQGKTRKVHNIILVPGFEEAKALQVAMQKRGLNITSDGRPMIGLSSRDFLDMCLTVSDKIVLIPAHIWTPWFSAMGEKSGFDSIEACYGDLAHHIHAVEIGLSANAPMNWMISDLDQYTLLANSDAHSPEKLGRNANIFTTDFSFNGVINAMKNSGKKGFQGTISFFPQEGKYHYAGHRKCNVCMDPVESMRHQGICPVCKKPLVNGVMNRIVELSDRHDIMQRPIKHAYHHLIPIKELLSEINRTAPTTKKITKEYLDILAACGPELQLLMHVPLEDLESKINGKFAEAISRMRNGQVFITEGFDGDYGKIKVFGMNENDIAAQRPLLNFDLNDYHILKAKLPKKPEDNQLKMF